jgi:uncharacterized protein
VPRKTIHANPFRYGDLALDDAFTDRAAEIKQLKADIRNGQNVVIFAPRRYGKSSLVWRATQELVVRNQVLVAQVDLLATPSKEKLAEKLAKSIFADIASPLLRAREKAVGIFNGLRVRPTITLDPHDASLSFTFESTGRREDIDSTLEHLLELPAQLAADRRKRVALVLDEFQEILEIDPRLPALMRSVFQKQPEVAHVYLGSKRSMMERLFNDANEPFWRSAKTSELGLIDPALFKPFIAERFASTDRGVDDDVVDRLLAITGGHPYATQELCYFLWEEVAEGGPARADALERALANVLRSESAHFTRIWSKAVANHRLILQALAVEPPARITDLYRRRHGLPHDATVRKALGAMIDDELVLRDARGYRIAEPFLAEWIRRYQS